MTTDGLLSTAMSRLDEYPLFQLVKLKLGRMLYGADAGSEDLDAGIGTAFVLLTLPGAFLSLLLFNRYGSLLRLLRGQIKFDPYAASLPDEYLFIVLAMLVSGGVALWKWDALFLDRRDAINIVPLPVHMRQILLANLVAILLFAVIFCVDVNAASAVLFPLVVSASQESFLFLGKIALGHAVGILGASLFSFAAVFALAFVFMAVLPARAFQAASIYLRGLVALVLLLLFASAFTVSREIATGSLTSRSALGNLPPVWFLGACQWARGAADATMRHFALTGFIALLLAMTTGGAACALAYKRHFSRMAETAVVSPSAGSWLGEHCARLLDHTVLRTPFEQSGFRFIVRTLGRSDRHRVMLVVFVGVGLVAGGSPLMSGIADANGPTMAAFAAPLVLVYCCVLGLRSTFDLPVELNANWIFRLLIAPTLDEAAVLAGKTIFVLLLPMTIVLSAMFALRWGGAVGVLQFGVLAVLSATLVAVVVLQFRKLPFTCAKAGFRQSVIVKVLLCVLGALAFAMLPAAIEHWALIEPLGLLVLVPLVALVWWGTWAGRSAQLDLDRRIQFQDAAQSDFELLNLSG